MASPSGLPENGLLKDAGRSKILQNIQSLLGSQFDTLPISEPVGQCKDIMAKSYSLFVLWKVLERYKPPSIPTSTLRSTTGSISPQNFIRKCVNEYDGARTRLAMQSPHDVEKAEEEAADYLLSDNSHLGFTDDDITFGVNAVATNGKGAYRIDLVNIVEERRRRKALRLPEISLLKNALPMQIKIGLESLLEFESTKYETSQRANASIEAHIAVMEESYGLFIQWEVLLKYKSHDLQFTDLKPTTNLSPGDFIQRCITRYDGARSTIQDHVKGGEGEVKEAEEAVADYLLASRNDFGLTDDDISFGVGAIAAQCTINLINVVEERRAFLSGKM